MKRIIGLFAFLLLGLSATYGQQANAAAIRTDNSVKAFVEAVEKGGPEAKLSAEQKSKIRAIFESTNKAIEGIDVMKVGKLQASNMVGELNQEALVKAAKVLNAKQRAAFRENVSIVRK